MNKLQLEAEVARLTAVQSAQPTPSMWSVLKGAWHTAGNATSSTFRVVDKVVGIVEREVDNIHSLQDVRLAETASELKQLPKAPE